MLNKILFASLPALFSITLFLSAGLLFLVEPMIAKMILPLLGGTPAVWNTCMMFFQAVLLAGYAYAHLIGLKAGFNRQIVIHLALLIVAFVFLPIALPRQWTPSAEGSPIGYVLLLLLLSVGLPFFILSSTALLLQKWFSGTGHSAAQDPYFLYSASNLGSMLALIGYPTLIEPYFRLAEQGRSWTVGYVLLVLCIAACAALAGKFRTAGPFQVAGQEQNPAETAAAVEAALTIKQRSWWVLLAFVPSSLMLGVTTFLSTDVAAIPLFWVVPLSLYLLSFIIVFARVPALVHKIMVVLLPLSVTALIFVNFSDLGIPKWVVFLFHLVNFFVYSMVCHGEIAGSRPGTRHLTEFYLWVSVGGVLGGVFNALFAPLAFKTVLEYPLLLALGALLLPVRRQGNTLGTLSWRDVILYILVPLLMVPLTYWLTAKFPENVDLGALAGFLHLETKSLKTILVYGSLSLVTYALFFLKKRFLFGVGVAAVILTIVGSEDVTRSILHRQRTFFGVVTVEWETEGSFMDLSHGITIHGRQQMSPDKRLEPISYYHKTGPAGQVFAEFSGEKKKSRIAVTGLGAGTLAAYAGQGQQIDFYEIDPEIERIATNPAYFTYLMDCRGLWKIILGDARLTMAKAPANHYDIIILDAFSSDAIPVHLLTREAVGMYFSKLSSDGLLLIHISNKYLDLAPVLASLADESGLASRICDDNEDTSTQKYSSTWVLLARKEKDFGGLLETGNWRNIERRKNIRVWTDDFSNLLAVFKW